MTALAPFARRLVPARGDLAAERLRGRVEAARFVPGEARAATALTDLTLAPQPGGELATQLLPGEGFTVYDRTGSLAWGQADDGYVGWVAEAALGPPLAAARVVTALASHVYPAPDIKRPPVAELTCLARVEVTGETNGFARLAGGGHVPLAHFAPVPGDVVTQAGRFLGVPYLWGGRSARGLDCSALVQLALMAAGAAAPRDSDMQAALLGTVLAADAPAARGDLVFWRGHVGILDGEGALLHANAHHMAVVREPFAAACARIAAAGGGAVTARRRLAGAAPWCPPV